MNLQINILKKFINNFKLTQQNYMFINNFLRISQKLKDKTLSIHNDKYMLIEIKIVEFIKISLELSLFLHKYDKEFEFKNERKTLENEIKVFKSKFNMGMNGINSLKNMEKFKNDENIQNLSNIKELNSLIKSKEEEKEKFNLEEKNVEETKNLVKSIIVLIIYNFFIDLLSF